MFPYKSLFVKKSPEELFLTLCKRVNSYIRWEEKEGKNWLVSQPSVYENINIITDLFTEMPRMKARVYDQISPLDFWETQPEKIYAYAEKMFGKVNHETLREAIYFMTKEATTFSPAISKMVYDYYLPEEGGHILDPFSGWGDRAIGALASQKVRSYTGVDVNEELRDGYREIQSRLDRDNRLYFVFTPFENFTNQGQKYHLIFTSPPYYDFEIYSKSPTQSITGKPTYEQWVSEWLKPVLQRMCRLLLDNGHLILHAGTTFRCPTFPDDIYEILQAEGLVFIEEIPCCVERKRPVPLWVYQKI